MDVSSVFSVVNPFQSFLHEAVKDAMRRGGAHLWKRGASENVNNGRKSVKRRTGTSQNGEKSLRGRTDASRFGRGEAKGRTGMSRDRRGTEVARS